MSTIELKHRSIQFIACGGAGINAIRRYRENHPHNQEALAAESYVYVDTSIANLEGVAADEAFLIEGADGSGSDRAKNAMAIKSAIPDLMMKYRPADVLVVVFSLAGGTGSAAGPMILEALLAAGHTAIGVCTSTHDSTRRTKNTVGTLTGLEQAVKRLNRSIVIVHKENDRKLSLVENDLEVVYSLGCLSVLASGRNGSLDSADIRNLFNFDTVTHHNPMLAELRIFPSEEKLLEAHTRVLAIASLLKDEKSTPPDIKADYDTTAFQPLNSGFSNSLYFAVTSEGLKKRFEELRKMRDDVSLLEKTQAPIASISSGKEVVDKDTGLVYD